MADPEDGLLDAALGLVSALDYAADIAALTGEEESRLYTCLLYTSKINFRWTA